MPLDLGALPLTAHPSGVRFSVRVKPRASKTAVLGVREGALEVSVSAPPVEGEANAELVRALAKAVELPRRDVAIVAGEHGKSKVVEVRGLDTTEVRARLERSAS